MVTTHLYDGRKSLPLDIELYQHGDSLPEGKQDREARRVEDSIRQTSPEFEKKTELAIKLIDRTKARKYQPGIVLIDAGYANNTSFLLALEKRQLKYLGGIAKNRKITINVSENIQQKIRIDE